MENEWVDIQGYENLYEISNQGKIRRTKTKKILKGTINKHGYYVVNLHKNKKQFTKKIHQLVAIAFLGHKPNGHKIVVDHKDNNPLNNCHDNLQIITNRKNSSKDKFRGNYSSKYVGVNWHKKGKNWQAHIWINGKSEYLGCFKDEIKAHLTYQNRLSEIENLVEL